MKRMQALREARGWNKSRLSHEARVPLGEVGKLERGERTRLYTPEGHRLAAALDWQGAPSALLQEVSGDAEH